MIDAYLVRWIISNVIALTLLILCWKYPKYGRYGLGVIFLSASIVNTLTLIFGPHNYLEYRHFAILDWYRTFIEGFFAEHIQLIVGSIAFGQLLISISLFYDRFLLRPAIVGGVLFSLGIIPLGIGSVMPVPIVLILSFWVLYSKQSKNHPNVIT